MDPNALQPYKDAVSSANNDVASQTAAAPGLLNQLKQNLTSIFAKDNPFIAERGTALQNYLNAPSQSRADTLPGNLPVVAGSNLNLSPTQQNAITTARSNAALVPLLGLNNIVTGLYGNIPGMVQGAGDIYNAQIQAAQLKSQGAQQSLAQAMAEMQAQEQAKQFQQTFGENQRQFNVTQANKGAASGVPGGFLNDIIAAMGLGGATGQGQAQPGAAFQFAAQNAQNRPPLESFNQPDQGQGFDVGNMLMNNQGVAGDVARSTQNGGFLNQVGQAFNTPSDRGVLGSLFNYFTGRK